MGERNLRRLGRRWMNCCGLLLALLGCAAANGQTAKDTESKQASPSANSPQGDLTQVSIENLMNMEVTSVSKKEQKLSRAAAAIFVITQEDIRRSGTKSIPDLLRIVPGVDVAQLDANIWVISIRGFADRFADKVLVLVDGRSAYTPTSSGVYWDQQDVPVEDIDRIEVIRGPGGTVWGANAVNGVINIITKSAWATPGGFFAGGAGSGETTQELIQYGGKIGQRGSYRVFSKYFNVGNLTATDGTEAADGWHTSHGGFRSDWNVSSRDTMTVQGDLLGTSEGETINVVLSNALPQQPTFNTRTTVGAGNVLGRWNRTLVNNSDLSLQIYYDGYNRHEEGGSERRNTFDLDFQHHLGVGPRQDVVWGLGYRVTGDNLTPKYSKSFVPARKTDNLFSGFVQDEIRLAESLWFTLGSKLEHNAYTGFEFEPSGQLVWTPTARQAIWASAARAVRQPARADTGIRIDANIIPLSNGGFGVVQISGDPNRKAEELLACQLGYRAQVMKELSFDLATFLNFYHHLQTDEPGVPFVTSSPLPAHTVFPEVSTDNAHGRTYGLEVFVNWDITRRWRISPGLTVRRMHIVPDASSQDTGVGGIAGDTPNQKFEIRSLLSLPHKLEWGATLYHVASLPDQGVPGYFRVDTRGAWRFGEATELSIVGRNLLTPRYAEFGDDAPLHTLMRRSVYGQIEWRFLK
jgi:iron complex outermembrane receptor protein